MNILELATKTAEERTGSDKLTAAKRAANGEKARELYAAFADLGGKLVSFGGERCKLNVTLGLDAAHISIDRLAKRKVKTPRGRELRFADTGECVGGWSAWHAGGQYVLRAKGGPEKLFAEQADLEASLAAQVGSILILE